MLVEAARDAAWQTHCNVVGLAYHERNVVLLNGPREKWIADGRPIVERMNVCQVHGKQLERQGWRFVRELHPVPGFERKAAG